MQMGNKGAGSLDASRLSRLGLSQDESELQRLGKNTSNLPLIVISMSDGLLVSIAREMGLITSGMTEEEIEEALAEAKRKAEEEEEEARKEKE